MTNIAIVVLLTFLRLGIPIVLLFLIGEIVNRGAEKARSERGA